MLSYDCQIRVWYKHTDQMAICHHSNYICYYEAARSELLRYLGMSFAEVEKRGIMMPILEVQSKYHRPAYYDELLTVRIMLRELPTARINFFYEIYNEKGEPHIVLMHYGCKRNIVRCRSRNVWPRGERMFSFPALLIPVFLPYFGKPVPVGFRHLPEHEPHPQDHIPESGSGSPAH